jgi:hypothetical protein
MRSIETATEQFETHTFPTTTDSLIEAFGDQVIEFPNGDETLRDVLSRMGPTTYETVDDARLAAQSAVSSKAIGRKGYSDRDPIAPGEDGPDQVSF